MLETFKQIKEELLKRNQLQDELEEVCKKTIFHCEKTHRQLKQELVPIEKYIVY